MIDVVRSRISGTKGQILVVFVVGIVVLLIIAALVVDVGNVWMIRRQEQDAADPGALAAARYIQPTPDTTRMREAACFYARQNGYFSAATNNDGCIPSNDAVSSTLTVNYPPGIAAGQYAGQPGYVEVTLTRPHQSFFAGIIGMSRILVSTSAVAAYDIGSSGSSSLIALDPTTCASGKIAGTGTINIHPLAGVTSGGYVQVNSSCGNPANIDGICQTSGGTGGLDVVGGASLTAPQVYVQGTCFGGGTVTGPLTEGASYVGDPLAGLRPPPIGPTGQSCGPGGITTTPAGAEGCKLKGAVTLSPGTYYGGWDIGTPSASITLQPGIYIIAGGGIRQTGGALTSAGGRVLIYSTDDPTYAQACHDGTATNATNQCQNTLNLNGATSLNLTGLDSSPCPPVTVVNGGCPYAGMLIWQDGNGSNPAPVALEGTTSLYLSGTIYAPKSQVKLVGSSATSGCTPGPSGNTNCAVVQIIANTFDVEGGAGLDMPYDPSKLYHLPLKGLVR